MSDIAKQNYELAFHLTSNLDEASVQKARQDIEKMVTSHGGAISFFKDPEKTRLAYPIKHQQYVYFGYLNFNLESPEEMSQIRDTIRHNNNVLRFLIMKLPAEPKEEDVVRRLAIAEKRKIRAAKQQAEKHAVKKDKTEAPKMKEGELDEKLEEIIGKIE